jgi:phospholipid/cholesterol/gamma-HCH transport system ATP-binding protein
MIEIRNIKKSFEGRDVLCGISGTFHKGLTNLIIGSSGTGKSVLLKCIVGLVQPDEGNVLFDGRDFWQSKHSEKKEIRREIGMLFQGSALFDSKTVEENVRFPLDMLTTMAESEKKDRVYSCLHRVGLDHAGTKMPSEISGGMKKRVGIARAIVLQTQYLFCDEPNSGLDPLTAIRIDQLISEIKHEFNITTIVVTHDMNSVMEIGENIMFLSKGYKRWEGNRENILEAEEQTLNEFIFSNELMRRFKNQSR